MALGLGAPYALRASSTSLGPFVVLEGRGLDRIDQAEPTGPGPPPPEGLTLHYRQLSNQSTTIDPQPHAPDHERAIQVMKGVPGVMRGRFRSWSRAMAGYGIGPGASPGGQQGGAVLRREQGRSEGSDRTAHAYCHAVVRPRRSARLVSLFNPPLE